MIVLELNQQITGRHFWTGQFDTNSNPLCSDKPEEAKTFSDPEEAEVERLSIVNLEHFYVSEV